jgi:hypothetical protein
MAGSGTNIGEVATKSHLALPARPAQTVIADGDRSAADRRRERKLKRKLRQSRAHADVTAPTPATDVATPLEVTVVQTAAILAPLTGPATLDETLAEIEAAFAEDENAINAHETIEREQTLREDVERLSRSLQEKDGLITALTDRLEQAAEQLDRLRRSGADKGWRGGGGTGIPHELIQDQREAIEELKGTLNRWEDMQAGLSLGRMEVQLGELRDLIVALGANRAAGADDRTASRPAPTAPRVMPAPTGGGAAGTASWWERQKAVMLGDALPDNDPPASAPQPVAITPSATFANDSPEADGDASPARRGTEVAACLREFVIPESPVAVDWESLTLESARDAIFERDRLIESLREPLLLAKMAGAFEGGVGQRDALPADQQQRLAQLEAAWEARFRKQELELSIERARLAREQMALRQQQEIARKELLRLQEGGAADSVEQKQERRWFRFMNQAEGPGTPGKSQK